MLQMWKAGHKSSQCKMKMKINELFAEDSQLKSKLLTLLIQENSDQSDEENIIQIQSHKIKRNLTMSHRLYQLLMS